MNTLSGKRKSTKTGNRAVPVDGECALNLFIHSLKFKRSTLSVVNPRSDFRHIRPNDLFMNSLVQHLYEFNRTFAEII